MKLSSQTKKRLPMQIMIVLGVALLTYHSAADWFATRNHNAELSGYVDAVEQMPKANRDAELALARSYNEKMPQGPLRDPYAYDVNPEQEDAAFTDYTRLLEAAPSGVMGRLSYPSAGINLPIYHGTADSVLSRGVGHLYGSSLPIGGEGTHSVLTSHSGLVNAKLFSELPAKTRVGDIFTVTVLGETSRYQVDQILTVLPDQSDALRIVPGEDYVTLITCTPIGVNSHRLLVRGTRIANLPEQEDQRQEVAGDGVTPGFPWWIVWLVGGVGLSVIVFLPLPRRDRIDEATAPGREQTDDVEALSSEETSELVR